jgi:hypothetical protein
MKFRGLSAGVAVFASGLFVAPASAAPLEQLPCIEETMGAAALNVLGDALFEFFIQSKIGQSGKEPDVQKLEDAANACATQFGWTKYERDNAGMVTVIELMRDKSRNEMALWGIELTAVDAIIESLPPPSESWADGFNERTVIGNFSNLPGLILDDEKVAVFMMYWQAGYFAGVATQDFVAGTKPQI